MERKNSNRKKKQHEEIIPGNSSTNIEDVRYKVRSVQFVLFQYRYNPTKFDILDRNLDLNEQIEDDIISSLPDDILCRIISFLPLDSAIGTSLLSTRWENLWKKAFLARDGTIKDAVDAVSCFLNVFHKLRRSDNNRAFQFRYGKGYILSVSVDPDHDKLQLDFSSGKEEYPRQFRITLLPDRHIHTNEPPAHAFKVKTLHLKSVTKLSSEAASDIVSNCKFIESLTITQCRGLENLEILDFDVDYAEEFETTSNTRFRCLTVLDCPQLKRVFIDCSLLYSFRYRGLLPCLSSRFGMHDDAMLDFRRGPGDIDIKSYHFTMRGKIRFVESLTLCRWFFETVICRQLQTSGKYLELSSLKYLWWIEYSEARYNSEALISFLKNCPSLERLYVTVDPSSYGVSGTYSYPESAIWPFAKKQLRVVKLEGFANEEDEMLLAMQLTELYSPELLIIAKSDPTCLRRLVPEEKEKEKEKEKGRKFPYKFRQGVENLHEVCPNHIHMDLYK